MRIVDLRSCEGPVPLPRGRFDVAQALRMVEPVCEDVRLHGEDALRRASAQFDHVVPSAFDVDPAWADACLEELDPALRAALQVAIDRRRRVCEAEADVPDRIVELAPGATVTVHSVPVNRVGLYVPGGLAPLASSVIMNVVAAQVAGVQSIALASPPQVEYDGRPHPTIAAVARMLGVDEILAVGGAQAIAMFAYGVPGVCDKVDMVSGPGNIYVVAAKRLLRGVVGIDSEAGPTEIMILADDSANPDFVAADLLSQAEHDPNAGSVLVTDSEALGEAVSARVDQMLAETKHAKRAAQALAGEQSAVLLVRDMNQGLDVVNDYAAEHLEIHTVDAHDQAMRVSNAGAIFVGPYAPVSLGDYSAGSTHVLPTGGAATYSSGLTVRSFLKTIHVIDYDQAGLAEIAEGIQRFALAEDLPAHANAVAVRESGASS